jgi:hypothetical protein
MSNKILAFILHHPPIIACGFPQKVVHHVHVHGGITAFGKYLYFIVRIVRIDASLCGARI